MIIESMLCCYSIGGDLLRIPDGVASWLSVVASRAVTRNLSFSASSRTTRALISRSAVKSRCVHEWGGWVD